VLPAKARLTDRDDFTTVVRRGRRAGRTLVVMHVLLPEPVGECGSDGRAPDVGSPVPLAQVRTPQVGFVVSKAVGGSVVRHRVARRLRHLMRDRLADAPPGSRIVVRALPAAAEADSASLGADLDRALHGALHGTGGGRRGSNPDARHRTSEARACVAPAVSRRS
jgi:ribonuclease P protein component